MFCVQYWRLLGTDDALWHDSITLMQLSGLLFHFNRTIAHNLHSHVSQAPLHSATNYLFNAVEKRMTSTRLSRRRNNKIIGSQRDRPIDVVRQSASRQSTKRFM